MQFNLNFLKELVDTYKKGLLYDELLYTHSSCDESKENLIDSAHELSNDLADVTVKYELLKEENRKLLSDGTLDILSLKTYYEDKYANQQSWIRDFDGKGKKDIRHAFRYTRDGEKELTVFATELIEKYNLKDNPTNVVTAVMKYFKSSNKWKYAYDIEHYKMSDFWAMAEVSLKSRVGDCDDLAILMHVVIYFIFIQLNLTEHYWRLKFTCGTLIGEGGHAFNIWLGDDGEYYVIESTYDLRGSFTKTWLKTPIRYNNLYKNFWGYGRVDRSWIGSNSFLIPYTKTR